MNEAQARKLETETEWNGKANVCIHCGRVPETFYIVTGHDHTDDSIRWCICRERYSQNEKHALLKENASLRAEVERLELEKEYRYVENILRPIRILLKVAECAESLADNSEEMEGEDGRIHVGMAADFDELSDALDLLDELPDDKPGYVLGGAAKAAWALHDIIGDTND